MEIRLLSSSDSYEQLTCVVRQAYKQLADLGFRYWGTRQTVDDTKIRVSKGECYVAVESDNIIATVTLNSPENTSPHPWYNKSDVTTFHQFAVLPEHQKQGVGSALLNTIERRATEMGIRELACDTSEGAHHLISFYKNKGFRKVGFADWEKTNYRSVVLSKSLANDEGHCG